MDKVVLPQSHYKHTVIHYIEQTQSLLQEHSHTLHRTDTVTLQPHSHTLHRTDTVTLHPHSHALHRTDTVIQYNHTVIHYILQ